MAVKKIELQERDIKLLLHIYNGKIITGTEIRAVHFNSSKFGYKRLSRLVDAGYLSSGTYSQKMIYAGKDGRQVGKCYRLAQRGADELFSRGHITHALRASRISLSGEDVSFILRLGAARSALIESGTISFDEWRFPREGREELFLPRHTPISCLIRDIVVLRVCGPASRYLASTTQSAGSLTNRTYRVVIIYDTKSERERLLREYVSGPVYMITLADFPALVTNLLAGNAERHMVALISRFRELYPGASFGRPIYGSVEVSHTGSEIGQKTLLVDGITGSIFAIQEFLRWPEKWRILLVRSGAGLRLISAGEDATLNHRATVSAAGRK
ncbi:MAG: hypothetical protein DDT32_01617 [Syntrophomonadaceae bacterium]|nr:hypothetical protein [Bacillota bacterium]